MKRMNKKLLHIALIFSALLLFSKCKTQGYAVKKTTTNPSLTTVDNLGNIYTVVENKLTKKNASTAVNMNYSSQNAGNIFSLDTKNGLQIMLFYKDFQEIILLDNSLAETSKISLAYTEFGVIDLVCLSKKDNSFWLFSAENQELNKVDKNLKIINKARAGMPVLTKNINPTQMIERNNSIYLLDENEGVFVFDLYGNYYKKIHLEGAKRIKINEKGILYKTEKELIFYSFLTFEKKSILSLEEKLDDFDFSKKGIVGIYKNEVKLIYKNFK